MLNHLRSLVLRNEDGQTTMEYGVLASLISVASIGILMIVGGDIREEFNQIRDTLLSAF